MIEVSGAIYGYDRQRRVLDGVNLTVPRGTMLGLLGRNGAGKTTLVKAMVGLVPLQGGQVRVAGRDPHRERAARSVIGVVHQSGGFESMLSAWDNLRIAGALTGLTGRALRARVDHLGALLGDVDFLSCTAMNLSGGQAKKLQILRALLHAPQVLFLDEPTVGLDVEARAAFYRTLQTVALEGALTVVWTSHYLEEIERNCSRAVLLSDGRIERDLDLTEFQSLRAVKRFAVLTEGTADASLVARVWPEAEVTPGRVAGVAHDERMYREVLPALVSAGVAVRGVDVQTLTLEDVMLGRTVPGDRRWADVG